MKTPKEILNAKLPSDLFTNNLDVMKSEYRELCKQWHPDLNKTPEAVTITQKLNDLFATGENMIAKGVWEVYNQIQLIGTDSKIRTLKYRTKKDFELGTMIICDDSITYVIKTDNKEFYDNAINRIQHLTYTSDRMKQDISKYLPEITDTFVSAGEYCLTVKKTPDTILLKDLLEYYKGKMPAAHVAWIMSSLYNIACYIDYVKLSHNSITIDNVFISPAFHSSVLQGWWYSVPTKEKMTGVPAIVYDVMPPRIKVSQTGHVETDLECIRLIGRTLLGDPNGTRLADDTTIPKPLINWLRGVSSYSAIKDYTKWGECLDQSWGKRKFVKMDININDIYK